MSMSPASKTAFTVAVHGFNQTERIVLGSIFGLSARRTPKFLQHNAAQGGEPDLLLVDASDPQAVALLKEAKQNSGTPSILIGDWDHGTGSPVLARPIQWTRLFKAFDLAVANSAASRANLTTVPIPKATIEAAQARVNPPVAPAARQELARVSASAGETETLGATARMASALHTGFSLPEAPSISLKPDLKDRNVVTQQLEAITPRSAPSAPATQPQVAVQPPPVNPTTLVQAVDHVLVVDDNVTVREFMRTQLSPFSFEADYAESGEQAIGMTGQKHYACVFLDVVMPGIDGYQVCKLIKSKKSVKKTAVVMLTSKGSPFDKIRGAMAGCDAYLTKPVDTEKLLGVISKFLPNS